MKKICHSAIGGKPSAFCLLPSAFTLIELLIVMVVISIMVGITIPISKYVAIRARLASQKIYVEKIKNALEDYHAAYGEYPITPSTNPFVGTPDNYDDVLRHYPADYATYCAAITQGVYSRPGFGNSPYINVKLATNTIESVGVNGERKIDYCLTYPLMLKQRDEGARPFMEFKDETVMYLVYEPKQVDGSDVGKIIRYFKTTLSAGGRKEVKFIMGNPINRAKAIDPASLCQWKYRSDNGVTYTLTTNAF